MAFLVNKLIKHDIAQELSTSIDNLLERITVELCIKQKIYLQLSVKPYRKQYIEKIHGIR